MTPFMVFSLCSAGSVVLGLLLLRERRQLVRAVPRMVVTSGTVRELSTVLTSREAGSIRSQTIVHVEFTVDGKPYRCHTLHLFMGNRHVGDVGKKYDFPPGQIVGVYYDPEDPRRNALVIDTPRRGPAVIVFAVAAIFAVMAAFAWR